MKKFLFSSILVLFIGLTVLSLVSIPSARAGTVANISNGAFNVSFASDSDSSKAITFRIGNYTFQFDYSTRQPEFYNSSNRAISGNALNPAHTTANINGKVVTYVGAYPNINMTYTVHNDTNSLKEVLSISSLPNNVSGAIDYFVFPLNI